MNLIICKRETGVERPAVELLVVVSLLTKFNEQGYHSNGLSMLYLKSFFKKIDSAYNKSDFIKIRSVNYFLQGTFITSTPTYFEVKVN